MKRYNHWFWNSKLMMKFHQKVTDLNSWLWWMMYGRKYKNDFWHAVDNAVDKQPNYKEDRGND